MRVTPNEDRSGSLLNRQRSGAAGSGNEGEELPSGGTVRMQGVQYAWHIHAGGLQLLPVQDDLTRLREEERVRVSRAVTPADVLRERAQRYGEARSRAWEKFTNWAQRSAPPQHHRPMDLQMPLFPQIKDSLAPSLLFLRGPRRKGPSLEFCAEYLG